MIARVHLFTTLRFIKAVAILVAIKVNASGSEGKPGLVDFGRCLQHSCKFTFCPKINSSHSSYFSVFILLTIYYA